MPPQIPSNDTPQVRNFAVKGIEIRAAAADADGTQYFEFEGHAAVFDSLSQDLGGFREIIKRGAFKDVLNDDVVMLDNHDSKYPLARGQNLLLSEDPTGLKVRAKIRTDLSYGNDLRINLEEGNITQMSFAFGGGYEREVLDDDPETGLPVVSIKRFKSLFDVSPVTYPAYPGTDAGLRSAAKLASGALVTDEEWAAVEALRSTQPTPDAEVRDDGATVQEPVEEVAASEERAEVESEASGAGMSAEAAKRRIALAANSANA